MSGLFVTSTGRIVLYLYYVDHVNLPSINCAKISKEFSGRLTYGGASTSCYLIAPYHQKHPLH